MKKTIFIFIFLNYCFAFSQQTTKKKHSLLRATLTAVGSATVYTENNKYSIQQSIGQSGIIGKKSVQSITAQQGFLTNNSSFKIDNTTKDSFKETLDFVISPNPFIDHIKIDFSKKTVYDVYIKIYDINGKVYSSKKFLPSDKIIIPMRRLSIGAYLIQIKSGKNIATKKLLKIE
ncbi:T9SS type A sorting domain-containing protein [Polaribacter sp. ALD11]|uniref:T9SS type A sorting domain-containing protein n=1 Tax=Polaribacter sp. ALD11 TaxID=2058137 RepID=UPI0012FDE9F4|nr:T9SS type A sorting domain-containing protein [Polaribacter sp. ALD11]